MILRLRNWLVTFALVFITVTTMTVLAQGTTDIPQVTIAITADGFSLPPEIPEGAVRFTFENHTEAPVVPFVARLNEAVTPEDLMAAFGQEDPLAFQALSSGLGGIMVMPGMTLDVTYALRPDNYVVYNLFGGEEVVPFTVADSAGNGATAPNADLELGLVDFAFNAPISIPAGTYTIHLDNTGAQFHMMLVLRLADTLTVHEIHELLTAGEQEELPEGVEEVTNWFPMSAGEQAWITLNLEPGTYLLLCPLPDLNGSGRAHHELGMRQFITVTEAN